MSRTQPNPAGWLWALGAATIVVAARWREIELHGGEIPFLDQWLVEGRQVLRPWLDGKLSPADFFRPHHEHVPVWTRLLVWLELGFFGQWDAQLQAMRNALVMGGFIGLFSAWLRRTLPLLPALVLTLLAVVLAGLPHSWENITWGFQSQIPLALLFGFAYLHGTFAHPPGAAAWWFAQTAGLAALFTLGSMWAAPLAVILVLLWTRDLKRQLLLVAALLTVGGVGLLLAARAQQPLTGAATLGAKNLPQFIAALLMHLGWPSAWPGAALLVNLPVIFLAWRLRGQSRADSIDRTVLAMALWATAQAAAFAYARGSYIGFVSRYGDLLALGVLANGVACWRLLPCCAHWSRLLLATFALGWCGLIGFGLKNINSQGHTLYFHEHSSLWSQQRREAVHQYLTTKDQSVLATPETRAVLFPDPAEVARLLDHPALAALLPASVRPNGPKTSGDFFSQCGHDLRAYGMELAYSGALLLLTGVLLGWRRNESPPAPITLLPANTNTTPLVLTVLALGSGALLFLWPQPFKFNSDHRWAQFLAPAGTVSDLSFHLSSKTSYANDRLTGGAALWPEDFRNTFFGTHIDGPAFTGQAESTPFSLTSPWYIVPFAGYPASAGNALKLRIEDPAGNILEEIACTEPNPGPGMTDIGFWAVDVRRHLGRLGRIVLLDQRTDTEGWIAAAPPHPAADGTSVAVSHRRGWAAEGSLSGLQSMQVISAILGALAVISLFPRARRLFC